MELGAQSNRGYDQPHLVVGGASKFDIGCNCRGQFGHRLHLFNDKGNLNTSILMVLLHKEQITAVNERSSQAHSKLYKSIPFSATARYLLNAFSFLAFIYQSNKPNEKK